MKKATPNYGERKSVPAGDVDAYLSSVPPDLRTALENLRQAIKAAAPQAEELISYRIPTYKYHGPLVHFVARQSYGSFVVVSKPILDMFKSELESYDTSGTTIHFTAEHPLPAALVERIVQARVEENESRVGRRDD
jgi:uncharacterized protein YdhG (YjbR/CyaY superfamily)